MFKDIQMSIHIEDKVQYLTQILLLYIDIFICNYQNTAPADPPCAFTGYWYFCTDTFSTRLESTKKMKQAQEARTYTDKSNLSPRILGRR